jgi:hypothetical protein
MTVKVWIKPCYGRKAVQKIRKWQKRRFARVPTGEKIMLPSRTENVSPGVTERIDPFFAERFRSTSHQRGVTTTGGIKNEFLL